MINESEYKNLPLSLTSGGLSRVQRSKQLLGETESLRATRKNDTIKRTDRAGGHLIQKQPVKTGKSLFFFGAGAKSGTKEDIPLWIEERTREIVIPYSHDGNLKMDGSLKLRSYQEITQRIDHALQTSDNNPCVVLPTDRGKASRMAEADPALDCWLS